MKKAAIFGVGNMGQVIAKTMADLGYRVLCADVSANNLKVLELEIPSAYYDGYLIREPLGKEIDNILKSGSDVVISALPYHKTETVAKYCINNGLRYCDLGGRVDVSERINNYAKEKATVPVMTDLGLAPGWVNILAEEGYSQLHGADSIKMMVGGIPVHRLDQNPLNYLVTWSVDGLLNEYKDDCEILVGGEIKKVKGMSGLEELEMGLLGKLEAFHTSGGASHSIRSMQERGVKDCSYKTLRYRGHRDIVRWLINECRLPKSCLNHIFKVGCSSCTESGDIVIIRTSVKKDDLEFSKEKIVSSRGSYSAMQRATATPIAVVADMMAGGYFDDRKEQHRDYWVKLPIVLSYKDIPFKLFNIKLEELIGP